MSAPSEANLSSKTAESFWQRVADNRLWDVMALLLALLSLPRYVELMPRAARASDFSHYYLSCRMLLEGHSPYATPLVPRAREYDLVLSPDSTTGTNPPLLQWLFAPFAMLNPRPSFWLWSSLQAASLGVIFWLTRRLLAERLSARALRFVVCGAVASIPMLIHFTESQTQLLIGALLMTALAWKRAGRPTAACVIAVAAGLLKLFPFVLLPWFVWRGGRTWRERAVLAGVSLAAIAAGVILTGPAWWLDFSQHGMPSVDYWSRNFIYNYCLAAFVKHCGWSWNVGLAAGYLSLVTAYALCLRLRDDEDGEFCLLTMAMLIGGTTSWSHYMVFAIFPVAVMAARVTAHPSWARVLLLAVAVMALDNVDATTSVLPEAWRTIRLLWIYTPLLGQFILAAMFAFLPSAGGSATTRPRSGSSI